MIKFSNATIRPVGGVRRFAGSYSGQSEADTLSSAIDQVLKLKPQLILLDDNLELSADRACDSIPYLRRVGFEGPIVVVSGIATRKRRLELLAAGAAEVLHKDDVDCVRINEVLPGILDSIGFELTKPELKNRVGARGSHVVPVISNSYQLFQESRKK